VAASVHADTPHAGEPVRTKQQPHTPLPWTRPCSTTDCSWKRHLQGPRRPGRALEFHGAAHRTGPAALADPGGKARGNGECLAVMVGPERRPGPRPVPWCRLWPLSPGPPCSTPSQTNCRRAQTGWISASRLIWQARSTDSTAADPRRRAQPCPPRRHARPVRPRGHQHPFFAHWHNADERAL
jgi:hypothetical protein